LSYRSSSRRPFSVALSFVSWTCLFRDHFSFFYLDGGLHCPNLQAYPQPVPSIIHFDQSNPLLYDQFVSHPLFHTQGTGACGNAKFVHGCNLGGTFHYDAVQFALDLKQNITGSLNQAHFTFCNRSKVIIDVLESFIDSLSFHSLSFQPLRILSFASSVGMEMAELQAHFPDASIAGYDIDSEVINEGRKSYGTFCNCDGMQFEFFSDRFALRNRSFDLVLANNFLGFRPISQTALDHTLDSLMALVKPGGLLELSIFERHGYLPRTLHTLLTGVWRKYHEMGQCVPLRAVNLLTLFVCWAPFYTHSISD